MNNYDKIKGLIPHLSHKTQVRFALCCAYDVIDNVIKEDRQTIENTLNLVTRWLNGEPVAAEELHKAAHASSAAAYAAYAAYAASNAARAASYAASNAAYAASSCAYSDKMHKYWKYLLEISDFTDLEKELYL